jgi:hypothetical protein
MAEPDEGLQQGAELPNMILEQVDFIMGPVQTEPDRPCLTHEVDVIQQLALPGCGDVDPGQGRLPSGLLLSLVCAGLPAVPLPLKPGHSQ